MSFAAVANLLPADMWLRLGEPDKAPTVSSEVGSVSGSVPSNVTLGVAGGLADDADTAASFDGTAGSYITISSLPSSITTVSFWCMVKIDNVATNNYIFAHGIDANNYFYLFRLSSGAIEVRCEIGGSVYSCNASPSLSSGVWYRLGVVLDTAGRREIYVNEVDYASNTSSTIGIDAAAILGARADGNVRLAGDLDEVILNYGATAWTRNQILGLGQAAQALGGFRADFGCDFTSDFPTSELRP